MGREYIKKPTGYCLGTVDTEGSGDQTVRDMAGRILGYYKKNRNVTTDAVGRIVAQGNCAVAFLFCDLSHVML